MFQSFLSPLSWLMWWITIHCSHSRSLARAHTHTPLCLEGYATDRSIHWNKVYRTRTTSTFVSDGQVYSGRTCHWITPPGQVIRCPSTRQIIKLHGLTCQKGMRYKAKYGQYKHREEQFKLGKAWNPSITLLKHFSMHRWGTSQKD
jgi:hypothetical protein